MDQEGHPLRCLDTRVAGVPPRVGWVTNGPHQGCISGVCCSGGTGWNSALSSKLLLLLLFLPLPSLSSTLAIFLLYPPPLPATSPLPLSFQIGTPQNGGSGYIPWTLENVCGVGYANYSACAPHLHNSDIIQKTLLSTPVLSVQLYSSLVQDRWALSDERRQYFTEMSVWFRASL